MNKYFFTLLLLILFTPATAGDNKSETLESNLIIASDINQDNELQLESIDYQKNLIKFLNSETLSTEHNSEAKACCKICRKGKACGDSCISKKYICHKPPGCACNG